MLKKGQMMQHPAAVTKARLTPVQKLLLTRLYMDLHQ